VKHIRKRLTFANVMSSIAVFLVLGGGAAYAAKKIGSSEIKGNSITTGKIKKEAITTSKIKKDAVTGAKVKESTLGQVPSALNATNATNAGNANTVGGESVTKIFSKLPKGAGSTTIATIAGFTITAACPDTGSNLIDIVLHSPTNVPSDLTAIRSEGPTVEGGDTQYSAGTNVQIELDNDFLGETSFSGATTTGTVISGNIGFDFPNTFSNEPICVVYGQAISG